MAVYMLIETQVLDAERYQAYLEAVTPLIQSHGGRYLVRGGTITSIRGDWQPERLVIIAFDTIEQAQDCFATPAYQAMKHLREAAAISKSLYVEGCDVADVTVT